MSKAIFVLLMVMIFTISNVSAYDENYSYKVMGVGNFKCSQYVKDRNVEPRYKNEYLHKYAYSRWVNGYLSAYNELKAGKFDHTNAKDIDSIMLLLDNICLRNPSYSISRAIRKLMQSF